MGLAMPNGMRIAYRVLSIIKPDDGGRKTEVHPMRWWLSLPHGVNQRQQIDGFYPTLTTKRTYKR
jgi:hypothetical protein